MADLYSVIQGLTPTTEELLEGELLTMQILQANYPDLDLRQGTAVRDLVLRPASLLFALCKKGVDYYFSQNTIAGITDTTPPDIVDSILSNWFLTRELGLQSVINARLYFARQKNTSLSTDIYFSPDNVLKFFPSVSAAYTAASMTYDSYSNEYYIDVDMTAAAEGSAYNIGTGSLLYFANFDPYFLRAEINYLKSSSINTETNTAFIARAETAISTRNLINVPSIDSNLRANFNYINNLVTVGMGQPEMLRDQVNAVFDSQNPIVLTNLTSVGTTATATLADHGFNSGQVVTVSGAVPSGYNGQYTITLVDLNTFTYVLSTSLGAVSTLPTVQATNLPLLIHNGGMVDIYCSSTLANSVVQVTTDAYGQAPLTGPIYSFTRSNITGGINNDTIPILNTSALSSISISGTSATATTTLSHSFSPGDVVTITGATQPKTVTSLTCTGLVVTGVVASNEYKVGNNVTIAGATPAAYNGTYTITGVTGTTFQFSVPVNIQGAATGSVTADINLLNSSFTILSISGSGFSFTLPQTTSITVGGVMSASSPLRYVTTNKYTGMKSITSIASAGTEVTVTVSHHGYTAGRYVTITGSSVAAYNGTWYIDNVINLDQFTFNMPTPVTGSSIVGVASFVVPWYDYGFSQNQTLLLDFGTRYANSTASFNINYFQNLDSIQTYLNDQANRVVCGDYLARGLNFYTLDINLTSYNTSLPDSTLVTNVITNYLANLPVGGIFIMSDMVTQLRLNGITNIQNPPVVTYKKYTRDLGPVITGSITDALDPVDITNVFLLNSVTTHTQTI